MNEQERAGLIKQSFELSFRGGSIWCEHLDSMGTMEAEVIRKLRADARSFARPSVSARMIVNLDETVITSGIAACIAESVIGCGKRFARIAFVGCGRKEQKRLSALMQPSGAVIAFLADYEQAKEWVMS